MGGKGVSVEVGGVGVEEPYIDGEADADATVDGVFLLWAGVVGEMPSSGHDG